MVEPKTIQMGVTQSLIQRVNACMNTIEPGEVILYSHASVYAAFLSDLESGRIDADRSDVSELLDIVGDFCALIEDQGSSNLVEDGK